MVRNVFPNGGIQFIHDMWRELASLYPSKMSVDKERTKLAVVIYILIPALGRLRELQQIQGQAGERIKQEARTQQETRTQQEARTVSMIGKEV